MRMLLLSAVATATVAMPAIGSDERAIVPEPDYAIYDQIVGAMFLTTQTKLVLIDGMTATGFEPMTLPDMPLTVEWFRAQGFFDGRLPDTLIEAFVAANQRAARLQRRFQFGVSYRLLSSEGEETVAFRAQAPPEVGVLRFSRVGYGRSQALIYVGDHRPDGEGAGFLIWFARRGGAWEQVDTDVIWRVGEEAKE